jgi:hypothetical protein
MKGESWLSKRIFQKSIGEIPRSVHHALNPKGIAFHIKKQVAVERLFHVNAPDVSKLQGLKVAEAPQAWPLCDPQNGFVD